MGVKSFQTEGSASSAPGPSSGSPKCRGCRPARTGNLKMCRFWKLGWWGNLVVRTEVERGGRRRRSLRMQPASSCLTPDAASRHQRAANNSVFSLLFPLLLTHLLLPALTSSPLLAFTPPCTWSSAGVPPQPCIRGPHRARPGLAPTRIAQRTDQFFIAHP